MAGSPREGLGYSQLDETDGTTEPFDAFVNSQSNHNVKETFRAFDDLCESAGVRPFEKHGREFVEALRAGVHAWKAKELWDIIDKRANRKEYDKGKACADTRVLIIGAGPCGLRAAIELALLGAKVVVVEKRDSFTRHNVLYLWNYLITDLSNLGAKKFYGRLSAGSINHISIIKLQIILLKVALLLGVEVHHSVEFVGLDDKPKKDGWRAQVKPKDHKVSKFEFDVIIAADGRQGTLPGFEWKESARTLAIGITSNFVNNQSKMDAETKEISGKSYIYDQEFFDGLKEKNIHLENIVYYKDETHYFVMTAKKQSLLDRGVIKKDETDTSQLLAPANVNEKKLQQFALDAALYATEGKLPTEEFAKNYRGKPDIAMFDFTSRKQAVKAAIVREENDGKRLIMAVVGDSCKEPFWPEGTGCALGFLGVFDTVWMIRTIANGDRTVEQALKNREVVYKLLSNTKQEDLSKDYNGYGIDPRTRYTSQVARNRELYKEEPRREYVRRDSSEDSPRFRPVSEFIAEDRSRHPAARPRLKSTPEVSQKSKINKRWSLKRRSSEQAKEDKKAKEGKKNDGGGAKGKEEKKKNEGKAVETKGKGKNKDEKKQKVKEKKGGKEDKTKNKDGKKEKDGKKNAQETGKDDKKKKEPKDSRKPKEEEKSKGGQTDKKGKKGKGKKDVKKGNNGSGESLESTGRSPPFQKQGPGRASVRDMAKRLETPKEETKQGKFKSLDRREISFNDAFKKFSEQDSTGTASSRSSSPATAHRDDTANQAERWTLFRKLMFWKRSDKSDNVDGKKKKSKKLRLKKKYRRMKARRKASRKLRKRKKGSKKEASYQQLGSESTRSPGATVQITVGNDGEISHKSLSVGSRASSSKNLPDSPTKSVFSDEVDGVGGEQTYSRMDGSEERIHQQPLKSERGGSFLRRIRPGKRKSKNYDRIQMETERSIGS